MKNPLVSLIIPAFNEEKTISKVLSDTAEIMKYLALPYEILMVDDASTDNTLSVALSSKAKVKFFSNETNRGKGYSIRKAAKYAKGDIIVTLDSDGEHNPAEIPALLTPIFNGIDIVAGSRFLGNNGYVTTKLNRIGNQLFNFSIMLLTGKRVTDSQTGFRAMRRQIFDALILQSDGYEIETEITVKSLINGFSFKEVPVSVERRKHSVSKIKLLPDSKKIMITIIKSSMADLGHLQN
jgi:glycosyltransferase involved in cell wall biosynthesis